MRIAYDGTENIWASRNDSQLYEINIRSRAVLKNTKAASSALIYAFGELQFSYTGSRTLHKRINSFEPLDIVNNGNFDILISDESNNLVHIIDFDGNFIR